MSVALAIGEARKTGLDYWIGLRDDLTEEDDFTWTRSGHPLSFDIWATNEPAGDETANCVSALKENAFFWKEENCDEK